MAEPTPLSKARLDALTAIYGRAASRLQAIVASPSGKTESSRQWRQARAAGLLSQVDELMASLGVARTSWATAAAKAAYQTGLDRGNAQVRDLLTTPNSQLPTAQGSEFGLIDARAADVFARDIAADLAKVDRSMGEDARKILRQTAQQNLAESDIDKILAGGVVEGTPRQTIRELKDALERVAGERITVPTKNGGTMEFGVRYYASMVARTKTRQAMETARHERLSAAGLDLVSVVGSLSKNFCTAYLGQVFSISGKHPSYPALAELPGGGPPFHPNCSKSTRPFVEELASPEQRERAEGVDSSDQMLGIDAATAQRRYQDLQVRQQVQAAWSG